MEPDQLASIATELVRGGLESVNGLVGVLIALAGTFYLTRWSRLPAVALGAVAVHIVLETITNVSWWSGGFVLPPFGELSYGDHLLKLFIGYLLVISALYLVKSLIRGHAG